MKKLLSVILVLALAVSLWGCQTTQQKMDALAGTYAMTAADSEEQVMVLLESIDAYEAEIALADKASLNYVQTVTFDAAGNYSYAYDADGTRACVRSFYDGYFTALYDGRTTLNEAYSQSFDDMAKEDFLQFYAVLYGAEDYEALLDTLTENAYNYTELSAPWESGTYTITGSNILCTVEGESEAQRMGYTLEGETLSLAYSNTTEVYTRNQ